MNILNAVHWVDERISDKYCRNVLRHSAELIKRKSENPPGDEYDASLYCKSVLEAVGFSVEWEEFESKRCNLIATIGNKDNIGLILNGHLDVVPATGEWKYPPYDGVIVDNRLYGRGSADMKGGVAAMLAAAEGLADNFVFSDTGFMLLFTADEERINKGIRHILSAKKLKARATVIGEPTELNICLGNKGYASYYIKTRGLACHASTPENGINAIYKMGRVLGKLEKFAVEVKNIKDDHLGPVSFNVGTIKGGTQTNIVPDECVIEVERRVLPGETNEAVLKSIQAAVGDLAEVHNRSWIDAGWLNKEHGLVLSAAKAISHVTGNAPDIDKFQASTESCFFSIDCKIPTIIVGPGSLGMAHKIDEYVPLNELYSAVRVYSILSLLYL